MPKKNTDSNVVRGRRGATRRQLLQGCGALAATGILPRGSSAALSGAERETVKNIYESIGVRPLINARGTVTIVGATRILPEVQHAMDAAVRNYVHLDELMEGVSRRLAELTGAEWGIVTSGASAAVTLGTAGCVTGGDPDKLWRIPDLAGMKDEVIIPAYSRTAYDAAARAVGVKMIEIDTREALEAALGPRTAMVMVLAGRGSESGPLSLREISSLAKPRGVPILVDAAAQDLPVPNPHLVQGADLVAYSGGKRLCGPQCAGLLLGRKDLVQASWMNSAPHHGFGRGFKVGREEIMGMLAAVEMWMKRDHERERRVWASWVAHIAQRLKSIPGVTTETSGSRETSLRVQWDMARIPLTGDDVEQLLWDGNPRIAVSGAGSFLPFPPNLEPNISINTSNLEAGEERIIADRVFTILSKPPQKERPDAPAAFDVSGQWDVDMKFSASTVSQRFVFEQKGNDLVGTHHASFAPRDLAGSLHGRDILVRSSCTQEGVRINFTFTGIVNGDTMGGKVSLSEYGSAEWTARRRSYQPARSTPAQ
jgi:D-glucosaminate-6-phosphate ammonia-lyase